MFKLLFYILFVRELFRPVNKAKIIWDAYMNSISPRVEPRKTIERGHNHVITKVCKVCGSPSVRPYVQYNYQTLEKETVWLCDLHSGMRDDKRN